MLTKVVPDYREAGSLRRDTLDGLLQAIFEQAEILGG
jgi:hypothetical protein